MINIWIDTLKHNMLLGMGFFKDIKPMVGITNKLDIQFMFALKYNMKLN